MYSTAFIAALCLVGCVASYDAYINAHTGFSKLKSSQITWASPLVNNPGSGRCRKMGVLKLNFGHPESKDRKDMVLIDMWFSKPIGWVFNIGNSKTNNGFGGDSGTTSRDSEMQGVGSRFSIFGNDYYPPKKGGRIVTRPNIIKKRFRVIIRNGLVVWSDVGPLFNYRLNMVALFSLNGQVDAEGGTPNYDIYFGINRVIAGTRRRGHGLCRALIRWL